MSKKRTHQVHEKKTEKMSITISKETLMLADRAARRQIAIENGSYRQSGTGVHGGNNKQRNRRDRHASNNKMRNWSHSDE